MAAMVDCSCDWCRKPFTARAADRKRGWARFCSKRCKAIKQESRTGQHAAFIDRGGKRCDDDEIDISDMDWGASDGDSGPL